MNQSFVKNLVDGFWKDAVLQQMLPQTLLVSVPVPMMICDTPCIGQFAYTAQGETGMPKEISTPVFQVVRQVSDGRVLSASFAPFFTPCTNSQGDPAGVYPGPGLQGKTIQECDVLYDKYYELCDLMLAQMQQAPFKQCASYSEWNTLFQMIAEDGFQPYFKKFFEMNERFGISSERLPEAEAEEENPPEIKPAETQSTPVRPVNLVRYFRLLDEIASESKNQQIWDLVQELQSKTNRQDFKVAVIGEFSRGKSHFLNELLETQLLPEGALPTTGILTQISHSPVSSLVHILPNRQPVSEALTQEACEKYTLHAEGSALEGVLKVEFPIPWLEGTSISFYDTPGVGDLADGHHLIATQTIYDSDAVILIISANAPCSLTELEFLRENIVLKGVPNVAVAISYLDTIRPKEVPSMIQLIELKVHAVLPSAQIWTLNTSNLPQATALNAVGVEPIREKIIQWSNSSELVLLRKRQTAFRIRELAEIVKEGLTVRLENAQKSDDEKRSHYEKVLLAIQSKTQIWKELELDVKADSQETMDKIGKELSQSRERLEEDLEMSLKKTTNPHQWLKEDLPYQMKRTKEDLSLLIEKIIQDQIDKFRRTLEQKVLAYFSSAFGKQENEDTFVNLSEKQTQCEAGDLKKTRIVHAIICNSLSLVVLVFSRGLSIASLNISRTLSEKLIGMKIESQKKEILPRLNIEIEKLFLEWERNVDSIVSEQYEALIKEIKDQTELWLKTRQESAAHSLEEELKDSELKELQDLNQKTEQLISEIREHTN